MTTNPILPEITPLEDRAIRRFEHDRDFHLRCYVRAKQLEGLQAEETPADYSSDLGNRLQHAMRELQVADELIHDDDSIVRGARYIGGSLLGLPYDLASVPEREGLKAAARRVLAAVEGSSNG